MSLKTIRMFAIVGTISLLGLSWAFADDQQHGVTLDASVTSVDKTTKQVTLSLDTMHDITSFIKYGDEVEIVIDEKFEPPSNQLGANDQKRSWSMRRKRPMVQDGQ